MIDANNGISRILYIPINRASDLADAPVGEGNVLRKVSEATARAFASLALLIVGAPLYGVGFVIEKGYGALLRPVEAEREAVSPVAAEEGVIEQPSHAIKDKFISSLREFPTGKEITIYYDEGKNEIKHFYNNNYCNRKDLEETISFQVVLGERADGKFSLGFRSEKVVHISKREWRQGTLATWGKSLTVEEVDIILQKIVC